MPFPFQTDEGLQQILSPGGRAIYSGLMAMSYGELSTRVLGCTSSVYGQGMAFSLIDRDNPELWAIRMGRQRNGDPRGMERIPQHATKMFAHLSEGSLFGQSQGPHPASKRNGRACLA